jgi:hypothetical protein
MVLRIVRRCLMPVPLALLPCVLLLPACASWDGHFCLFGYSTRPNYDTSIRTVRVPVCKNRTYWVVTPAVGMEMDLTRAIVRQIEMVTPYKVVECGADTELRVTIVGFTKNTLAATPYNTPREVETSLMVDLVWRDLRTGRILSRPPRRPGQPAEEDPRQPILATPDSVLPPGTRPVGMVSLPTMPRTDIAPGSPIDEEENTLIDPLTRKPPVPVQVRSVAHFRIELGESLTTALQKNYDRMAQQIVSAMEIPW